MHPKYITKSLIALKAQKTESWNFVCPNILETKYQPFLLRIDRDLREQLGVQKSNLGFQLLYIAPKK